MNKFNEEIFPQLFDIAGAKYYFDLDQLSHVIRIERDVDDFLGKTKKESEEGEDEIEEKDTIEPSFIEGQIIDVTKWETIKVMVESILNEQGPIDEAMGITKLGSQLSIPFKLSFNTLINYKIIKQQNGR